MLYYIIFNKILIGIYLVKKYYSNLKTLLKYLINFLFQSEIQTHL